MFSARFRRNRLPWKITNPASIHREWIERAISQGDELSLEEEVEKYESRVRDWKNLGYDVSEFESEIGEFRGIIQSNWLE